MLIGSPSMISKSNDDLTVVNLPQERAYLVGFNSILFLAWYELCLKVADIWDLTTNVSSPCEQGCSSSNHGGCRLQAGG
jgi:hypothetical protein